MVNKKGKRVLKIENRIFYWYVKNDWYSLGIAESNPCGLTLYVISEDRKEAFHYLIGSNFMTITAGKYFSHEKFKGWRRFRCPVWSSAIITPGIVKDLVNWHLDDNKDYIETDYAGNTRCDKKI